MTMPSTLPESAGRSAAFLVYCLYLLSIPSAGIFALVGVILALSARADASPAARTHLDDQIRIWFVSFWWHVGLAIVWMLGMVLTIVIIGFPILLIVGLLWFILMVWFTIKSALGLMALLDGRGR
jgi:uncharacterized membrane protein